MKNIFRFPPHTGEAGEKMLAEMLDGKKPDIELEKKWNQAMEDIRREVYLHREKEIEKLNQKHE